MIASPKLAIADCGMLPSWVNFPNASTPF